MKTKEQPRYLVEWDGEGKRLAAKTDRIQTISHLTTTGFTHLKRGAVVVDAGAGVGIVSEIMHDLLAQVKKPPRTIIPLDVSSPRLHDAEIRLRNKPACRPICCDLESIPLENDSVDFIFSRFLFEYLKKPMTVFRELVRILKPGGKIVIGDVDYGAMVFYPISKPLGSMIQNVLKAFEQSGFDLWAGRKLFSYYHGTGMENIKVHASTHNVMYGPLSPAARINWTMKMEMIEAMRVRGTLTSMKSVGTFQRRFIEYLQSEERFSYTPYIMVEGTKPKAD